ncbi:hypothetical protein Tco_0870175 [Tanacetum coccineum]
MDNPNITMKEYIRLQEEKALSRGETFNWQTATYGKMEYCEDEDDCFTNFKTEFPAIVLDNTLTSNATISYGPTDGMVGFGFVIVCEYYGKDTWFNAVMVQGRKVVLYCEVMVLMMDVDMEYYSLVVSAARLKMDNPNITMKEYIRLQEEKALSRGETFNWQTATYGKMEYCEDEDDCFTNFKTEFPAIVLDNTLTSNATISYGPTVSPLNDNEIDFRLSFDESDDEDYTVVYDENSFSYKIISVNNLKTDSENDNDKVNMPSFPSLDEVNYSNDLDFFKDFENALMHKAKVEESWGDATPGVIKFCAWLKSSFENFHELDYNVLVKLEECWRKVSAHEVAPFTRWENYGQGPYANAKTKRAYNPYLDINCIFGRNYGADNASYTQDNQEHKKEHHDPSTCRVRRFEMIKYSFDAEDEYVAIKEHECSNHLKTNIDTCQAYQELFLIMDEGWLVMNEEKKKEKV